jgi:hypothetical protein
MKKSPVPIEKPNLKSPVKKIAIIEVIQEE